MGNLARRDGPLEVRVEKDSSTDAVLQTHGGIDPDNEVKGPKLLLLHIGLCLCTFLVGLVEPLFTHVASISIANPWNRTST